MNLMRCHMRLLGSIYLLMRKYEKAIESGKRAVELDPNGAQVHVLLGEYVKLRRTTWMKRLPILSRQFVSTLFLPIGTISI